MMAVTISIRYLLGTNYQTKKYQILSSGRLHDNEKNFGDLPSDFEKCLDDFLNDNGNGASQLQQEDSPIHDDKNAHVISQLVIILLNFFSNFNTYLIFLYFQMPEPTKQCRKVHVNFSSKKGVVTRLVKICVRRQNGSEIITSEFVDKEKDITNLNLLDMIRM